MYGYNRAIYGLGADPTLAEIAKYWSTIPKEGYTEKFYDHEVGQEIYGTPEGAAFAKSNPQRFEYLGSTAGVPLWKDPIVMIPAAGVAALIFLGILMKW